jgi:hypothetical protein
MNTDEGLGRKLPRAKPVTLTFYDLLKDYPYITTFYVREEEPRARIEKLIEAIRAVSNCVLGTYKIGYEEFTISGYREKLHDLPLNTMGSFKWVIKYRTKRGAARSFTIPGRDERLSVNADRGSPIGKAGKRPDVDLPQWQTLAGLVKQLCVSKEGEEIMDWVDLDYRNEKWPPKGAKRR